MKGIPAYAPEFFHVAKPANPGFSAEDLYSLLPFNQKETYDFEQVLALIRARGEAFRILHPSPYAGRLRRFTRSHEPDRLVDTLLCGALIEARSCERFGLLAEASQQPELQDLYRGLLASEARHHGVYLKLAEQLPSLKPVHERLAELAEYEAQVLADVPPQPRMHA